MKQELINFHAEAMQVAMNQIKDWKKQYVSEETRTDRIYKLAELVCFHAEAVRYLSK